MHGVKRVRYSKEVIEARKQRDQARLKEYLELYDVVLSKRNDRDFSRAAFDSTTTLLRTNPELYTAWNYRRSILLTGIFPESTPAEINQLLSDDLSMTFAMLKQHPKVYWIWNHRRWCLESVPNGPTDADPAGWKTANWNQELFVVEKMLDADARNFHAWNYRRYILTNMENPPPPSAELAYTTGKIEANFSNFSAWHQRSKTLTTLWEMGELDPKSSKESEFELVQNAMYTDPDDQSVWIYHAWLIGNGDDAEVLKREIRSIQELLDEQPDSKWCMESLVRYKKLLLKHHAPVLGEQDRDDLVRSCLELLAKLETVDPSRRNRYRELGQHMEPGKPSLGTAAAASSHK